MRTLHRQCNDVATCTCAVASRVGDDVIVVDRCGGRGVPITVKKYSSADDVFAEGFTVSSANGGMKFTVRLPNSATVTVEENQGYLNVFVRPALSDFGKTAGLCGTYDNNRGNDMTTSDGRVVHMPMFSHRQDDFSRSWRVDPAVSIYTGHTPDGSVTYGSLSVCSCTPESNYVPGADMNCPAEEIERTRWVISY